MAQAKLEGELRLMVRRYGFEQVNESLQEIGKSESYFEESDCKAIPLTEPLDAQANKRAPKVTAPQYVAKMDLPPNIEASVVELARRFDQKSFLPTMGDIANFCEVYRLNKLASKSRASAIPRVFKHIASMEADDIQRMLDEGMFFGPSRLGPIADAIRRNGRSKFASNPVSSISDG